MPVRFIVPRDEDTIMGACGKDGEEEGRQVNEITVLLSIDRYN